MHTIDEVLLHLDQIIAHCTAAPSRQAYFAILYRQMTAAVKNGIEQNVFEDPVRMEKLDVIFASRYIHAWHAFQQKLPTTNSWQHAMNAANNRLTVIQHLLLGMNVHINLDLPIAAAATAPGQSIFALQKDFAKINVIIEALSGEMQKQLERIWWPMKLIGQIANGQDKAILNFSIAKARQAAWANSVALALATPEASTGHITFLDNNVTAIGKKIESPGRQADFLLSPVKWMEPRDIPKIIRLLK